MHILGELQCLQYVLSIEAKGEMVRTTAWHTF